MKRFNEFTEQGQIDIYDMDLFNLVYRNETTVLPDIYGMLDAEFEGNYHDHVGILDDILKAKGDGRFISQQGASLGRGLETRPGFRISGQALTLGMPN